MFMRVQKNFEMKKSIHDYVDISKYTGMEIEHGQNTAYIHPMNQASNLGHFNPNEPHQNELKTTYEKIKKDRFLRKLRTFANDH